ncbi:hypothetical protein IFM89_025254 [Coptis chinensis]|uniref:Pentatricopeptide repeat-containing protein n=1 Tax=Coptis chinensis TaxID=261450 RepID=A0A835I5A7_9MAGN|nr:hypothetical protein IFM89_025254 [Coptis chinensis]
MTEQSYIPLSAVDVAGRLDLIAKVQGVEKAEKYFDSIPVKVKKFPVYNALLYCYVNAKSIEKAEAFMQQMKQLGLAKSPLSYNALLSLYSKVGQYEKLDILIEEMKDNSVRADKFTLSIWMAAYAANSDIDGMDKILQSMEVDPEIVMDWNAYAIAAKGYIKVGLIDKALEMLKSSEKFISGKRQRVAYDFLLTLYAGAGSKEDLNRIWKLYKSSEKLNNTAYLCMIRSLLKFDDIAGAENILAEWESGDTSYDLRVPNLLIAAYCKNGLVKKAEMFINRIIEKGKKPLPSSWDHLATGDVEANQFPMALKALESAFLARRRRWLPSRDTLSACLEYLRQQGDVERTEEFLPWFTLGVGSQSLVEIGIMQGSTDIERAQQEASSNKSQIEDLQPNMKKLFFGTKNPIIEINCLNIEETINDELTLVGKMHGGYLLKLEEAGKDVHRIWQTKGRIELERLDRDHVKIRFENIQECKHVITNGPWMLGGYIFSVKEWMRGKRLEEYRFDLVKFWVQIWDLPKDRINKANVWKIDAELGMVMEADISCPPEFNRPVARVRVEMDVKERLKKDQQIKLETGEELVVRLKYEKLEVFCYFCGVIGHDHLACRIRNQYCYDLIKCGGTIKDIKPNFTSQMKANKFYNGVAYTIADTPSKLCFEETPLPEREKWADGSQKAHL